MRARTALVPTLLATISRLASTPLPPRSGVHTRTLHMCRHREIDTHPRPVGAELPIHHRPRAPCSLLTISFPRVLLRVRVGARRLWAGQIYHCDVSLPSHSTCHVPGPEVMYVLQASVGVGVGVGAIHPIQPTTRVSFQFRWRL
jgi:hypothetical protein